MSYYNKYLKYKNKYLKSKYKNSIGGSNHEIFPTNHVYVSPIEKTIVNSNNSNHETFAINRLYVSPIEEKIIVNPNKNKIANDILSIIESNYDKYIRSNNNTDTYQIKEIKKIIIEKRDGSEIEINIPFNYNTLIDNLPDDIYNISRVIFLNKVIHDVNHVNHVNSMIKSTFNFTTNIHISVDMEVIDSSFQI